MDLTLPGSGPNVPVKKSLSARHLEHWQEKLSQHQDSSGYPQLPHSMILKILFAEKEEALAACKEADRLEDERTEKERLERERLDNERGDEERRKAIIQEILANYSHIIDNNIEIKQTQATVGSVADPNMAVETGLVPDRPFMRLHNKVSKALLPHVWLEDDNLPLPDDKV